RVCLFFVFYPGIPLLGGDTAASTYGRLVHAHTPNTTAFGISGCRRCYTRPMAARSQHCHCAFLRRKVHWLLLYRCPRSEQRISSEFDRLHMRRRLLRGSLQDAALGPAFSL